MIDMTKEMLISEKEFAGTNINKTNLFYDKGTKFTNNNKIKIKREVDGKVNFHSYCIDCGFKKFCNY